MSETETMNQTQETDHTLSQLEKEYTDPVRRLITVKDTSIYSGEWRDYPKEFGLTHEHVPELTRMALETRFDHETPDWQDASPYWAPIHAVRALGQLKASEAASQLLPLLAKEDDAMLMDMPKVLSLLGPSILPKVIAYLENPELQEIARVGAGEVLVLMAEQYPETLSTSVNAIRSLFACYPENERSFNGMLLSFLTDLKVVEAVDLIQEAFEAEAIDETIDGDWIQVKHKLGLPFTSSEHYEFMRRTNAYKARLARDRYQIFQETSEAENRQITCKKAKDKRKVAKAARKRNRKK